MSTLVLDPVAVGPNGVDITTAALTALTTGQTTIQFPNDGRVGLIIENGSGSSLTLSEVIEREVEGEAPAAITKTIPNGKTYIFGSLSMQDFDDGNGNCNFTVSSVTSVSVGLIEIPFTA